MYCQPQITFFSLTETLGKDVLVKGQPQRFTILARPAGHRPGPCGDSDGDDGDLEDCE